MTAPSGPQFPLTWALPNEHAPRIRTIETHAAGEPLRIVVDGLPHIPGATILEKRRWAQEHLDDLRRALILEPRGHRDMYAAILTEPVTPDGHLGVLFLHNEGFSTMCGHGIIALSATLRRMGVLPANLEALRIDTPAGRVEATFPEAGAGAGAGPDGGTGPVRVGFRNVPSFVLARDREVEVEGLGRVRYDLAFGGAFYALVEAADVGISLRPEDASELARLGRTLQSAIASREDIVHPLQGDLGFLYGVIFVGPPENASHHSRNVCIFGDGEVDRSPTGTGVSARAALHHARHEVDLGEEFTVESILGTTFSCTAIGETRVGERPAVVPWVEGTGHLTGRAEYFLDPADPLRNGVLIR
ncbi:MAG: proline racemase family protein [Gemmatimonadota bacterium]